MPETPEKIKYPADRVVHWPTGPVPCCMRHADELVALGRFMGGHTAVTRLTEPAECVNCRNEAASEEHGAD